MTLITIAFWVIYFLGKAHYETYIEPTHLWRFLTHDSSYSGVNLLYALFLDTVMNVVGHKKSRATLLYPSPSHQNPQIQASGLSYLRGLFKNKILTI